MQYWATAGCAGRASGPPPPPPPPPPPSDRFQRAPHTKRNLRSFPLCWMTSGGKPTEAKSARSEALLPKQPARNPPKNRSFPEFRVELRECGFSAALSAGGQPALSANPGPPCTLSLFLTTKKMPSLAAGGRWRASQDKEIFRLSHSSPTPLPLITMIGGAVPVQQNAAEVQPGKVVTLGKAAPATRQMSQFFSARGLSSSTAAAATAGEELCVEIFSFRRH